MQSAVRVIEHVVYLTLECHFQFGQGALPQVRICAKWRGTSGNVSRVLDCGSGTHH